MFYLPRVDGVFNNLNKVLSKLSMHRTNVVVNKRDNTLLTLLNNGRQLECYSYQYAWVPNE